MEKQVDKEHYNFSTYITKKRWISYWHQCDEVLKFDPKKILEVGGGANILKKTLSCFGVKVETCDIAEDLNPDHVGSVTDLPFSDNSYDVACAFQVLEHIPFELFPKAVQELKRCARKGVVISLPYHQPGYPIMFTLPRLGQKHLFFPNFWRWKRPLPEGGEHHWEINRGESFETVLKEIVEVAGNGVNIYRVPENRYHVFFRFSKHL
jgi:ubiquinone/menaquinone biosynthesis C-methylase UbiE